MTPHYEKLREEFYSFFLQEVGGFKSVTPFSTLNNIADWWLSKHKEEMQRVCVEERLKLLEILHKYAMQTKSVEALDLVEKAQKEILSLGITEK